MGLRRMLDKVPPGTSAWVSTAARLLLAGVWIYASVTKIPKPSESARAVQAYQLLPYDLAAHVGRILPILELALGLLLLIGLFTRFSAVVSAVLLVVFIAGIASAWYRGLQIDCGCFGGDGTLSYGRKPEYTAEIVRDVLFLAGAAWLALKPVSRFSVDGYLDSRADTDPAAALGE